MTFDVQLEARQIDAPAPGNSGTVILQLAEKDSATWDVVPNGASGTLTFNSSGDTFDYTFSAAGLNPSSDYSLIYYADPYPGNHPGKLIGTMTTNTSGAISGPLSSVDLNMDLPGAADANYPAGAKIQLVLSSDYNSSTNSLTAWHPSEYLFEMNLVKYEDSDD